MCLDGYMLHLPCATAKWFLAQQNKIDVMYYKTLETSETRLSESANYLAISFTSDSWKRELHPDFQGISLDSGTQAARVV